MSEDGQIDTAAVTVKAHSLPELTRLPCTLKFTMGGGVRREAEMARKRSAKAYRFLLSGSGAWLVYIGPVRNKAEARRALIALFGEALRDVRVHPLCDPFPTPGSRRLARLRTLGTIATTAGATPMRHR